MDPPPSLPLLAELDLRLNALLRSHFGIDSMDEYVRLAGADAFLREGTLPANVMDAAQFLDEVRHRQQEVQLYTRAILRLKPELERREAELANKENCRPTHADSLERAGVLGGVLRLREDLGDYQRLLAAAQMQLWQLSLPEKTQIIDKDAVRAELDALVERRLRLALQLRVEYAERLCAARATKP